MTNSMKANLTENKDLDNVIHNLLLLHNNETTAIKDTEIRELFDSLLIALFKVKYNVRFCSNEHCRCHPESTIKEILENKEVLDFIENYSYINKDIQEMLNLDNYKPTTIFD